MLQLLSAIRELGFAVATERVAKFLGKAGLAPMPAWNEQPKQSAPKKKAQERAKAAAAA